MSLYRFFKICYNYFVESVQKDGIDREESSVRTKFSARREKYFCYLFPIGDNNSIEIKFHKNIVNIDAIIKGKTPKFDVEKIISSEICIKLKINISPKKDERTLESRIIVFDSSIDEFKNEIINLMTYGEEIYDSLTLKKNLVELYNDDGTIFILGSFKKVIDYLNYLKKYTDNMIYSDGFKEKYSEIIL